MSMPPPPPPPPSKGVPPPPTTGPSAPAWGAPPAPSAAWGGVAPAKPPRPAVPVAGYLLLGGAALAVLGSLLNWFTIDGQDVNGFTEADDGGRDGPAFVVLAVILASFGITFLAAKRVFPVAILAVIAASSVILAGIADLSDVSDQADLIEAFGGEVDIGPGIPVVIVGGLVALAGGIVALATRRR